MLLWLQFLPQTHCAVSPKDMAVIVVQREHSPPQASPQHPVAAPAVPCTSAGLEPPVQGGIPQVLIYTPAERQSSLPTGGGFL